MDSSGSKWRRIGKCNRCGACCKSGDPFAPRVPKSARQRPCSYLSVVDGAAVCTARDLSPSHRARRYYDMACRQYPENPRQREFFPDCGFCFKVVDGD